MTKAIVKFQDVLLNLSWLSIAKLTFALLLLTSILYLVGMSQIPAVHESFHDVRHAMGFPCH